MKLSLILGILLLSILPIAEERSRITMTVEIEKESRDKEYISPKFILNIESEKGEMSLLKGINLSRKTLDGIEAILISPLGDTSRLVFPNLSLDTLKEAEAHVSIVSKDYPITIEVDMHTLWSEFQKRCDKYIGPYPGEYKIRFEFGWSEENWQKFIESGVLKYWKGLLINEKAVTEWTSFKVPDRFFELPTFDVAPLNKSSNASQNCIQFQEVNEGLITREWLIDASNNFPIMVFSPDSSLYRRINWKKIEGFDQHSILKIENYQLYAPSSDVSGSFVFFSTIGWLTLPIQSFSGRMESGKIDGEVELKNYKGHFPLYIIQGIFKEGKMHGKWITSEYPDKKQKKKPIVSAMLHFESGLLNGHYQEYYPLRFGGGLFKEAIYENDKIDGVFKTFHNNGKLQSLQSFLPENNFSSTNYKKRLNLSFPIPRFGQTMHGSFLSYYDDGELHYHYTFDKNLPINDCEFHFRWNKKQFDTYGTFKDGLYFEGTFLDMTRIEPGIGDGRTSTQYQYWILYYTKGELIREELIIDTRVEPLLPPKWKLFKR